MDKIYQKSLPAFKNAGFTLIELLVVVLIIGILAAIVVPQYQVAVLKSRFASVMAGVKTIANAAEVYYMANGTYPPDDITALDISSFSGCKNIETGQLDCGDIWYDLYPGTGISSDRMGVTGRVLVNGSEAVRYIQYMQYNSADPGGRYCRAYDNKPLSHKVCKSMGGVPVENNSTYYRFP